MRPWVRAPLARRVNFMEYTDKVYGKQQITEPVILELINCYNLKRLVDVNQGGYKPLFAKQYVDQSGHDHSRFDHSVGVYLLLKQFGAPLEEQIAGLIHDVSHAAFSHCIDFILKSSSTHLADYQDSIHENYVKNSVIPDILKKYSFELNYILDDKNFPLKETKLPNLCADRIDYFLRDALVFDEISQSEAQYYLDNLVIDNKRWVFKNSEAAGRFAKLFSLVSTTQYSSWPVAVMFRTVGDYFGHALKHNYITLDDLYTTDSEVLNKAAAYLPKDDKLKLLNDRLNKKTLAINDPKRGEELNLKAREVDPLFYNEGKVARLSEVDAEWKNYLIEGTKPKKYHVAFEK